MAEEGRWVVPVRFLVNELTPDVVVVVTDEDWEAMQAEPVGIVFPPSELELFQRDARLIHFLPESQVVETPPAETNGHGRVGLD